MVTTVPVTIENITEMIVVMTVRTGALTIQIEVMRGGGVPSKGILIALIVGIVGT